MKYELLPRKQSDSHVNVEIPRELHRRTKVFAVERGVRLNSVVAVALAEYLNRREAGNRPSDLPLLRFQASK
jgi:predicted HicB family RNase H-like nuclease